MCLGASGVNARNFAVTSNAPTMPYVDLLRGVTDIRSQARVPGQEIFMSPASFVECFVAQLTASSAIIDPRVAVSPNVLGTPVRQVDGVFQDFGASGNKVALCAHVNRFNYWWTRSGINIEITNADDEDFKKYVMTVRAQLRTVFCLTQAKAFTVMSQT